MNPRQRIISALKHKEPDRVPFDLGSTGVTGITGVAYYNLKRYLDINKEIIKIIDPIQQLAQPEPEILQKLGVDTRILFIEPEGWELDVLPNGIPCKVVDKVTYIANAKFKPQTAIDGSKVLINQDGKILYRMPKGSYYYEPVYRPLTDARCLEDIKKYDWPRAGNPYRIKRLKHLRNRAKHLRENGYLVQASSGWISIFEQVWGYRGFENFMIDLVTNEKFATSIMDQFLDVEMELFDEFSNAMDGYVDVVMVGDDLGGQDGPLISPTIYRRLIKPRQKKIYEFIKDKMNVYIFLHTCGSVYEFIPDFIEIGVDILNPIQVSANNMNTKKLKQRFGDDLVFWGGGCDTQRVLPQGTLQQVKDEVKRRIEDLAPGGGFVFSTVHNIQPDVPPENIVAMRETLQEY